MTKYPKPKKQFFTSCVNWPYFPRKLDYILEHSVEISKDYFLRVCDVNHRIRENIAAYPNDYKFFSYKGKILFYRHSAIEYFYK